MTRRPPRRSVLAGLLATLPALSGCLDGQSGQTKTATTTTTPGATDTMTGSETDTVADSATADPAETGFLEYSVSVTNRTDSSKRTTVTIQSKEKLLARRTVTLSSGTERRVVTVSVPLGETLTVSVSTTNRRKTTSVVAREPFTGLAAVVTASDVEWRSVGSCELDCPALDASGRSVEIPYTVADRPQIFSPPELVVGNPTSERRPFAITVERAATEILAYDYQLPGETRVVFPPIVASHGSYDVTVVGGTDRRSWKWSIPESYGFPILTVRLTSEAAPLVGCGYRQRLTATIHNETDSNRTATLALVNDGGAGVPEGRVAARAVSLGAGTSRTVTLEVQMGGQYRAVVGSGRTNTESETDGTERKLSADAPVMLCDCFADKLDAVLTADETTLTTTRTICK